MTPNMDMIGDWVAKHPVGTGVIVFGGGLGLLWMLGYLTPAKADSGGSPNLAGAFYQAEAAQTQAGAAIQVATLQTAADTAMAKIQADAAIAIQNSGANRDMTINQQNTGTANILGGYELQGRMADTAAGVTVAGYGANVANTAAYYANNTANTAAGYGANVANTAAYYANNTANTAAGFGADVANKAAAYGADVENNKTYLGYAGLIDTNASRLAGLVNTNSTQLLVTQNNNDTVLRQTLSNNDTKVRTDQIGVNGNVWMHAMDTIIPTEVLQSGGWGAFNIPGFGVGTISREGLANLNQLIAQGWSPADARRLAAGPSYAGSSGTE